VARISNGTGVNHAALALHGGSSRFQVAKDLCVDRQPVSEAVVLYLPSFVVRGDELGDRRRAQSDGPN
jgi:hypothetical protein